MRKLLLGNICSFKYGKTIIKSEISFEGLYPVFSGYQIVGYLDSFIYNEPQLLIVCRGIGGTGDIKISPPKCSITNLSIVISVDKEIDKKYLYWVLRNADTYSLRTGSAQPQITITDLQRFSVRIHESLIDQKAIAHILSTLDKKIEINKKSNANLEGIAKALFKSWFIDFDPVKAKLEGLSKGIPDEIINLFPNSFVDSAFGKIPSKWDVQKLGNIISIKYGKNFPKKNLLESGYPVFGGNGIIGYHSSFLYKEEMTLMSCRGAASGSILRSLPESFITNNSLVFDHTANKFPSQRYVEYFLQSTDRSGYVTGSAQPQVTIESIYNLLFLVPDYELLEVFQNLITPLNQKYLLTMKQNRNLELLRNTLSPKLISGEIRIHDAEKMIDKVESNEYE